MKYTISNSILYIDILFLIEIKIIVTIPREFHSILSIKPRISISAGD